MNLGRTVNAEKRFDSRHLAPVEHERRAVLFLDVVQVGNDAEQVDADERFDVPRTLHPVVEEAEGEGDTDKDDDTEADAAAGDAVEIGGVGAAGNGGTVERTERDFLQVFGRGCLVEPA